MDGINSHPYEFLRINRSGISYGSIWTCPAALQEDHPSKKDPVAQVVPGSPACPKLGFSFKNRKPLPQTREGFLITLERSLYFSSAIRLKEV